MRRLWLLVFLAGCASSDHELAVEVLSDLQPGVEVDRIEVRLDDLSVFDGLPARPLTEGARVADLEVSAGDHVIAGRAFFNGELIAERRVLVQVREDQGLTVALTRNCRDVRCAEAGTTCSNAVCVDPQCSPETPQFCEAAVQCERSTDCDPAGVCGNVECLRGSCLTIDDGRCGSGFFCAGDEGCVVAPFVVDAGMSDASMGMDARPEPDAGPVPRTCPEPWGALPVSSAAVVGDGRGGDSTTTISVTPADALLAPTLTIEMWVRFIEPVSTMFLMGSSTREDGGFSIRPSVTPTGDARIMYTMDGSGFLFQAPGLTDGCWHHIALVRDLAAGIIFYIQDGNREFLTLTPRATPLMPGEAGLFVGRNTFGDTPRAHVAIHHLRFWNTALSDSELDTLRTTQAPPSDPRLIDEIPMQTATPSGGVDRLDSRGTLETFFGWYADGFRGNAPGTLMTLDELDVHAARF
ncbi:MAG: LamG domain-containing protein [Polyangiales bacterium]